MQQLDIRTIFIMAIVLNFLITICFIALWVQHRKQFKGIGLFTGGLLFTTLGYIGIGSQGLLHSLFSVVLGNSFVALSLTMVHNAFKVFLYKNAKYNYIYYFIPLAVIAEQIFFTYFYPSLLIRLILISSIFCIQFILILSSIIQSSRRHTLPGIILISSYIILFITFIIRIPLALKSINAEVLISTGILQAVPTLVAIVTRLTTPLGFILLVTQELHFIEQKRVIEKEQMLREVHHRIKNNMQTMESILVLQAEAAAEPAVQHALNDAAERLTSMMILYNKLYRGEDLENISASSFLSSLVDEILAHFPTNVTVTKDFDEVSLPITKASFTGIILNELITNTMKYAFRGKSMNNISMTLKNNINHITITFHDNGIGFNTSKAAEGFGLNLCRTLVHQMEGTFNIINDEGTKCTIEFDL